MSSSKFSKAIGLHSRQSNSSFQTPKHDHLEAKKTRASFYILLSRILSYVNKKLIKLLLILLALLSIILIYFHNQSHLTSFTFTQSCILNIPQTLRMKTILITGAAGFIGMHTSLRLKQLGAIPIGIDIMNEYYDVNLKWMRVKKLKEQSIRFLQLDLCNRKKLEDLFQEVKFDHILHLAAQAGVRNSIKFPLDYVHQNIYCFVTLLEVIVASKQNPIVVYASSSSAYGKNAVIPFKESLETESIQQKSVYGASKAMNEMLSHVYHEMYGLRMTGLRFFTVYGSYGRPDMAYFSFADKIMNGSTIQLYNHGNMLRDFTFISDIVEGILGALAFGAKFEIFNLGRGHTRNVQDLVKLLEIHLNRKAKIKNVPFPGGEVLATFADTSKAERYLCYRPSVELEDGILAFLDWYRQIWLKRKRV